MRIAARKRLPPNTCAGFLIRSGKGVDLFGIDTTRTDPETELPISS